MRQIAPNLRSEKKKGDRMNVDERKAHFLGTYILVFFISPLSLSQSVVSSLVPKTPEWQMIP